MQNKAQGQFVASLRRARLVLRLIAGTELTLAALVGSLLALGLAAVLVGLLPFSLTLRSGLWALVGVGGLLGALAVTWRRLIPLGDDQVVAARLEAAARRRGIDMGDAVQGAVGLLDENLDATTGRSRALCDAHIAQTTQRLQKSGALSSVAAVGLQAALSTLLVTFGAMTSMFLLSALFPDLVTSRLARLFDPVAAATALQQRAAARVPLVTNLSVTVRYPAYMNKEDLVIAGSSGDLVAPLGAELTLDGQADRLVKSAALLFADRELAVKVREQKHLTAHFVIDQEGSYRFRLTDLRNAQETDPVAHNVVVAPDTPPEVTLDTGADASNKRTKEVEKKDHEKSANHVNDANDAAAVALIQLDDVIAFTYAGKDDFGLSGFKVVVRRQGFAGDPKEEKLAQLAAAPRQFHGAGSFTAKDMGARAGDRLSVWIEATDNDTVSGPKTGRSVALQLRVYSATDHHRKLIDKQQKLLNALTDLLADDLEQPLPAKVPTGGRKVHRKLLDGQRAIVAHADGVLKLLDDIVAEMEKDALSPTSSKRALRNMRSELRPLKNERKRLLKRTVSTVDAGKSIPRFALRRLLSVQRRMITRVERHILYLEDLLNTQRIEEAKAIADELRQTQQDLKTLIEQYRKQPDENTRKQIMEEIQRMREQMKKLMQRLAELQREVPDEYLNEEAFKGDQMLSKSQDLDTLIQEGKLDDAVDALDKMLEQTQKLNNELGKDKEKFGDDEYAEVREKMRQFGDELSALQRAQEELKHRSDRMLKSAQREAEKRFKEEMDKAFSELSKKAKTARNALVDLDKEALFSSEREDADFAKARLDDLLRALKAKDVDDALRAAEDAEPKAQSAERSVTSRTQGRFGVQTPRMLKARDQLQSARSLVEEMRDELAKMLPDPAELLDKAQRRQIAKDAAEQAQLAKRAQALGAKMDAIGKEMPIFGPAHKENIRKAGRMMRGAKGDLSREDLRRGRAQQNDALRELKSLQDAMEQMGQGQGGQGGIPMPLPGGQGGSGEKSGNGRGTKQDPVKIPGADAFRVPDAFRKDILDAMREGAPKDWRGEVRKYYEELIK